MNAVLKIIFGLLFQIVMQYFVAIRSAVLEKMTLEVVIFVIFPNISELISKLSLPPWGRGSRMCRC